jgi:hypothetical protein
VGHSLAACCLIAVELAGGSLRADIITPPTVTAFAVPSTARVGQAVTVSASAAGAASDNSDGHDWNANGQSNILRLIVEYRSPDGRWKKASDWLPSQKAASTVSATLVFDTPGIWYVNVQAMDGRPWYSSPQVTAVDVSP